MVFMGYIGVGDEILDTECIGDKFEILVTVLAILFIHQRDITDSVTIVQNVLSA